MLAFSMAFSILFPIGCLVFLVYFLVRALRFFKQKELTDKELLQKMDELLKLQSRQSDDDLKK